MTGIKNYIEDFLHLFFPHICMGCNTDVLNAEDELCAECLNNLPDTGFLYTYANPVEKIFYGRLSIEKAGSAFYFNKDSVIQNIIIQLKYKSNQKAGIFLGRLLGQRILKSGRFDDVDLIIPLPLNDRKLLKRGYNQSEVIAKGVASVWHKPVVASTIERIFFTETQTHKDRIARWQTMEGVFSVTQPSLLQDKHILLVDDVITTGATLEACGEAILQVPGVKLSLVTVAYTI
ncbi:MAG TPA: phosphoribosyltransferase family protein [Chitinophagaceae bacterium]